MEIITSTANQKIKDINKLKQVKYRNKEKKFIVETLHLIEEAIKANKLDYIITDDLDFTSEFEVIYVKLNVMKLLSSFTTPSHYIGIVNKLESKIDYDKNIVVLDNIQDPGNLGTILRNALAFNFKNIILGNDCVDIYNEKVIQASQGAIFSLNIEQSDLLSKIDSLKEKNYDLVGTALTNARILEKDSSLTNKSAIFFGNEGTGLKKELIDVMNYNYCIPIENIDSLNVANASAIIFYQLMLK